MRGNWIAGPDFAYRLCIDAFDDAAVADLDLSCLHLATNGAEPVRPSTLSGFVEKFRSAGLRDDVLVPQYGLAEAGLGVAGTVKPRRWVQASFDSEHLNRGRAVEVSSSAEARRTRTLVSCGDSTLGWDVRIVDPERRTVVPDGEVGEIWVGGEGLPDGYWRRPEVTAEIFGATTVAGAGPYLRTGDAGFFSGGELFICGRYRDLIIVGGGNYFPNDIESTVEEARCGVDSGGACAVQPETSDSWWLIVETADPAEDLGDISRVLRRRILSAHQTAPERIIWVRPRVLPRTTSGKIRRRKALSMLEAGHFDVLYEASVKSDRSRPQPPVTELAECVSALLGVHVHDLDGDTDLIALGLTSVMTAQVVEWAVTRSRHLDFAALYAEPTLRHWQQLYDGAQRSPVHLPHDDVPDPFATTALQRAYWVGRSTEQPLGGVGCQTYFELDGATIDPGRLNTALDTLARRHPMLRSMFPDPDRCCIDPENRHVPVPVHDLTDCGDARRRLHLDEVRTRLRAHRFDIETGDTWRVELTRLPDRCVLHFAINLIIADLSSIGILLRDLAALYRGDQLPSLSTEFGDGWATVRPPSAPQSDSIEALPECPQLPWAEERDIVFRRRQHTLDTAAMVGLDEHCRTHGVTRAAVFLAAYSLVLRHWSGAEDFLVNVTTFGRPPGISDVIGDFTRTHLYRCAQQEPTTVADWVRGAQRGLRTALAGPESTDLLAAQLRAGTGHSGIAPVVFTYAGDTTILPPRDVDTLGAVGHVSSMTPQVLIDNQVGVVGDNLVVSWDYRAGCFPTGVVADMFDAYIGLLEGFGGHDWSTPAVIELPQRSRSTRQRRNATSAARPEGLLFDAFREQATNDPGRVALRWTAGEFEADADHDPIAARYPQLTYGALDDHARRVAGVLVQRHAPGSIIGIQLLKGPSQVVAALGVLMAGCSYLPVGVDQPADRFARICAISGMSGLIRSKERQYELAAAGPLIHDVESMIECVAVEPVRIDPEDTAYVIYTSGSTGEPKGVLVSHAAALNTIVDVNRRNEVGAADVVLAVSALDFDLSVYDIFGPLSCGASLVMISEQSRRDAFHWNALVNEFAVTVWNSVPALLDMLLIAAGSGCDMLPSLRSVFLSGDWIPLDMPKRLHHAAPRARLVAMGGATEAAIWSNEFVLAPAADLDPDWVSVPYGYPLCNQMFRVVDDFGRDRPDYVAGELWIGGAGVAQGYHNAPELTAERFVLDENGIRWYRTGDLGCYWHDGTLQFLGRIDSQVKIGGHRVECGEIEHVLREYPSVENAAVVPIQSNKALGAILVCNGDIAGFTDATEVELRRYLAERLPQYMIPRLIMPGAELPLTGNGKVDRRWVAEELEEFARAARDGQSATDLTTVERVVAGVWSEVLGAAITRRGDNFFAHGGDSLRATQVVAQLKNRGVIGADVGQLLGHQTLGEFSSVCLVGARPHDSGPDHPRVQQNSAFPLTRLQQAYVLGSAGLHGTSRAPTFFSIVLAVEEPGDSVDLDRFGAVVSHCVAEFAVLRCVLDDDTSQRVHDAPPVPVDVVAGTCPESLMKHMAGAVFDPRAVPVVRCFALSGSSRYVGLLINYLSLDARSLATVIATIIADYQQTPRLRHVDCDADVFARFAADNQDAGLAANPQASAPAPVLPLAGRPLGSRARVEFERMTFNLGPLESAALRDRAAQQRVAPTALVFEAFTDALHSIGAGERFAVVVPKTHRPDYAPVDREVLGNFTRLALCEVDYSDVQPGSLDAVTAAQRELWRAIADDGDATGLLAALRTAGSPGYPVVFTSTLGLAPHSGAQLLNFATLTQTPGVWLDCQVEDDMGGIRVSWDTAGGIVADEPLAVAFLRFEQAVRRHAGGSGDVSYTSSTCPRSELSDGGWASAVIGLAASLCDAERVRPQYAPLLRSWQQRGEVATAGQNIERAARRLADIVTGAASPHTLVGDPQLAPEAMLLAEDRLQEALDDLAERIFAQARHLGRRLRIVEVGSRTGLISQRITQLVGAVVDEYVCFEPNAVLAEIASGRHFDTAIRQLESAEQLTRAEADVVICCGSLHQLPDAGPVLDVLTVADGGWLWVAENCEITSATLASAAVLNPDLLAPEAESVRAADQWWRFIAQHHWQPEQMTQDGPGLTIVARRHRRTRSRPAPRAHVAPTSVLPAYPLEESVLGTIAGIWQRHLNIPTPTADDDFFLLGADSLVATRVYADLRAAGFTRLALVDLFNYPVLAQLVAKAGAPSAPHPASVEAGQVLDEGQVPLTVVQHAYLAGRDGGFLLSGVAAHCYFEFEATDFDRPRFETAVRQLISYHPGLRTTVTAETPGEPSPRCAVVHPAPIEPVISDYDDVRTRMRDQVIDVVTRPGIDFGIQSTDDGRTIVGISMDNIMLDGTSMMIALGQLDHLYRSGSADGLPPLRTSFAQYVGSHPELWPDADEADLPALASSRDYWRSRLPSLPRAPELADLGLLLDIDKPVFERATAVIEQDDWRNITQRCRVERVTAASFLLAGYARVLSQWAGTTHFCVNVTLFDRDHGVPGIDEVIGDFTSLLLLECQVDATESLWEQARRLQRQLLTDLPHRAADAVWLQRELLRHHGIPGQAVFPVVFTSGLGLVDTSGRSAFDFGELVFGLSQTPQTVLDFQMWERAGALSLSWDFVTQAVSASDARRYLDLMVAGMVAAGAAPAAAAQPHDPGTGDEFVDRVLRICATALNLPRVEASDNFFLLGGDSATATRVVEQLSRDVSATATLRLLFEHPVLGEFAAQLATVAPAGETASHVDTEAEIEEGVL
nr:non-ribosomal peptide synthetase [Mycobacterium gordonae]